MVLASGKLAVKRLEWAKPGEFIVSLRGLWGLWDRCRYSSLITVICLHMDLKRVPCSASHNQF